MIESDNFIYSADDLKPIKKSYGRAIYDSLLSGGSKTAVVDAFTDKELTYSTLRLQTLIIASFYKNFGFKENDVISICGANSFEIFVPAIAAFYLGIVVAPVNPAYTSREMVHILNISKPKLVFCSIETLNNVQEAIKVVPSVKKIILFGDTKIEGLANFQDLLTDNDILDPSEILDVEPDHVAAILCSSGTTGPSKGVMLTYRNLYITTNTIGHENYIACNTNQVIIALLPYFHAYGFNLYNAMFMLNMKFILMKTFNEKVFLSSIEKYKVTLLPLVPPVVVILAKSRLVDEYNLSSIKDIICGAAPLKKDIEEFVTKKFNLLSIRQIYGLTECSFGVIVQSIGEKKHGSVGRLVPGMIAKIVDLNTGKTLGPNEQGELLLKGAMVMKGYLGDPMSTSVMIDKDGWLHTGDLGYYDMEHSFYIIDRLKELIKFKGFQVPPAELEGLLLMHPKIKDVAVIGQKDEKCGELPVAFVVRLPNHDLTEQEVIRYIADNLSYHKRLHGGVRFVNEIPKNPTGKILRRILRESLNTQHIIIKK